MTKRAEKWPVIDIIRGGLGLVTDKTKKKKKNRTPSKNRSPTARG